MAARAMPAIERTCLRNGKCHEPRIGHHLVRHSGEETPGQAVALTRQIGCEQRSPEQRERPYHPFPVQPQAGPSLHRRVLCVILTALFLSPAKASQMQNGNGEPESAPAEAVVPRSHRLVRRLVWLFAIEWAAVVVFLCMALLPPGVLPQARAVAREAFSGGLSALVLTTLLLPLTALLGTLSLTWARFRFSEGGYGSRPQRLWDDPGFAARQCQALIVPVGTLLIWLLVSFAWPEAPAQSDATDAPAAAPGSATTANLAAAFVFALAFVSLVAERVMAAFPAPQLPEAPALRRLLLLTTLLLVAAAGIELGRGAELAWVRWPAMVLICVPGLIATELSVRALARMFLPPPAAADATAVTESLLASVITGGPRTSGSLLKTHLGLDFARSWALRFLSAAILPAVFATALLCWCLTGLKLIDLGQRGIYERFGAPVAVLGPGLHLLLPWPLGRLRPVEYGTIHSVAIGVDEAAAPQEREESVAAEAMPPASLNRLWESSHPGQANYLVPSRGTGQEGFQSVSTEISVLYRVGLTDAAAMQSVYTVADPESLIRQSASRLVLRYFNSRELDAVLGARRENVAGSLREALAANMDEHRAGVEIVSVLIEEIHPPAGAAGAYHAVQAAEINANASISQELGRAKRAAGVAQQEAHQLTAAADAQATETVATANAETYRFNADRRAYAETGEPFLLERSYSKLKTALAQAPLTIIDHRLSPAQGPVLDLRNPTAASRGSAAAPASAPAPAARGSTTPDIDLPE
jgi:regulator of protease activity HflC (stomatin/prohibitin superfamily)